MKSYSIGGDGGILNSKSSLLLNNTVIKTGYKYNLHYAPHIGMFKNHAGNDPI